MKIIKAEGKTFAYMQLITGPDAGRRSCVIRTKMIALLDDDDKIITYKSLASEKDMDECYKDLQDHIVRFLTR